MEYLQQLTSLFETKLLLLAGVMTLAAASGIFTYRAFRRRESRARILKLLLVTLVALALSASWSVKLYRLLRGVPAVLFSSPGRGNKILAQSPDIRVTFSAPVIYGAIAVHTNPPLEFTVEKHGYFWNLLPFGTTLTIKPNTTLPPGEPVMVYFANIEGPATKGFGGEQLLEMTVEDPAVRSIEPPDKSDYVSPDQTFAISLSVPVTSLDEWSVRSDPEHPLSLNQKDKRTLTITPDAPFQQGKSYRITLTHSPVITSRSDGTRIRQLDGRIKADMEISVVKAVFVSSFSPGGTAVDPEEPIVITFEEPMDEKSLETFVKINPETEHTSRWDPDTNALTLRHDAFRKDTEYAVTLLRGLKTERGGSLDTDATFRFKTAGPVLISETQPADNAENAAVGSEIKLTFNQDVPDTISDHVRITPETKGTFSVNGNVLEFKPAGPLKNATAYTVSVSAGAPSVYGLPSDKEQGMSFRTIEDQTVLLVPYYRQQTMFTCNIAAARMLLAFRGIKVTETELIDAVGNGGKRGSGNPHKGYIDDFGTFWEPILQGVTRYRGARLITSGNLTDILNEVKKGNPVMTWGQNGWSDPHYISWTANDGTFIKAVNGMHSVVVRGYVGSVENPRQIFVNDPWRGQYAISTDEFMRRWRFYSMAMVIE